MKSLKSLTLISLLVASLSMTGCTMWLIQGAVEETKNPPTKITQEQDSLVGFVINQDGQLVMLGQRYVYVFDNYESTDRLKKILTTPEFLTLKYNWEVNGGKGESYDERMRKIIYRYDGTFEFSAFFWYQYSNTQELAVFQKAGLAQGRQIKGANGEWFEEIRYLHGKVYQHNTSTKALLKTAKPLSKPYSFAIDRQVADKAKLVGGALLLPLALPFAIVGDILILPVSLPITLNGGKINVN